MSIRTKYENFRVIGPDTVLEDMKIYEEDGKILAVTGEDLPAEKTVDGKGAYLSAGWIDMHTHGAGGADFLDGTPEAFRTAALTHRKYGATTVIPTTTSVDREGILREARRLLDDAEYRASFAHRGDSPFGDGTASVKIRDGIAKYLEDGAR